MWELFGLESPQSKRLRKEWGVPERIEFEYIFNQEGEKKEYLVEIKPTMNDFKGGCGERLYAKITLKEVLDKTFENVKYWKPKLKSKIVFSDKFLLTKNDSFENFKYNFSCVSGLEKNLVEDMLGDKIKTLINYRKKKLDPSKIINECK
jgi:hypothetical protein